jgi:DNA-binding PadR family transcriptional regulator
MRQFHEHFDNHHHWQADKFGTKRGDVRLVILAMLKEKPMHGYELISTLDKRTNGLWRPSPGSIYPTLQMLEEEELIVSNDTSGKKVYELTEAGRLAAEQVELHQSKWDLRHGDHENIRELMVAMHDLKRLVRRIALADPAKRDAARDIVTNARQQLTDLLESESKGTPDEPQTKD